MTTPFKKYRISQAFGVRPEFYKKYGFNGHEGIDIVAQDENNNLADDWQVLSISNGVVVRDVDDPRLFDGYGNLVVIWDKENKRSWWYAHNANNRVSLGDTILRGQIIAETGLTGNTSGKHLHLGTRASDDNGNPINTDNGFKGFENPLSILNTINEGVPMANISIDLTTWERVRSNSEAYDELCAKIGVARDSKKEIAFAGLEQKFNEKFNDGVEEGKKITSPPPSTVELDLSQYEENGLTVETTQGSVKKIVNYKRKE